MSNPNGRWEFDSEGNVHYIAPDGTDTPGATPTHDSQKQSQSTKKSGDSWHWLVIVLGYIIAWPVGLILTLLELTGKWPGEKAVSQQLHRFTKTTKKSSHTTYTAYTTSSTAADKPTKRQKRRATKQEAQQYGLGNIRLFKILGGWITGVFGFATMMTLIEEIRYFFDMGYLIEEVAPLLAFTLIGVTLLGVSHNRSRKLKKFRKYLTLMGNREEISISALSKTMGIPQKKVMDDLEEMLERGVFETGYIDASRNVLVLREGMVDIPEPEPEPETSPVPEQEPTNATLQRIRTINDAIANPELSEKINHIEELTAKIFRLLEERPEKASDLRSFMNFYLPQTLKILENYAKLEAQGIEGDNIAEAKQKIEGMMDRVVDGYESQLDKLFADDVLDISADLKVMESMLEKDGLTLENDFKL